MRGEAEAEFQVLTTDAGRALLEEVGRVAAPRPADLSRWRKRAPADLVAAALRLAECRRRAVGKFSKASEMWLEAEGLEQATAEPVALHKASRFEGGPVVDLCSGIGGDGLAIARRGPVLAVDLDPAMNRRVLWNAEVHGVSDRLVPVRAKAETFPLPAGARIHVDPDRRTSQGDGRRAKSIRDYSPGLEFLMRLPILVAGGAVKLGPASDFGAHFDAPGLEIELISLRGECKEATVWFGDLATCRRRATRLPEGATWTDRSAPEALAAIPPAGPLRWVFDPDPALVRSGLIDAFAAAHGLARCASGIDFLTGPELVPSPFLTAFEVEEVLPLDLKILKKRASSRKLGPLEIKVRGVDIPPETLRERLRPPGPHAATLLLMGGGGPRRALLAKRVLSLAPEEGAPLRGAGPVGANGPGVAGTGPGFITPGSRCEGKGRPP